MSAGMLAVMRYNLVILRLKIQDQQCLECFIPDICHSPM